MMHTTNNTSSSFWPELADALASAPKRAPLPKGVVFSYGFITSGDGDWLCHSCGKNHGRMTDQYRCWKQCVCKMD